MKLTRDIQSLSVFKRDSAKFTRQMKKTKQPIVLTVNGKATLVVQDAESYQELLEAKDRMETIEGIRRGLADIKAGRSTSADEFFTEFFSKYDIPVEE
jgi:PHD/YefM family antitoxin component YafN of YafNO toxin-antitoxin module